MQRVRVLEIGKGIKARAELEYFSESGEFGQVVVEKTIVCRG